MDVNKLETIDDLKKLFLSLNEPIYRYVYLHIGYQKEIAEDITQDIFLKAWEKKSLFNAKRSTLKNWIYSIARNHLIDVYRKAKNNTSSYNDLINQDIIDHTIDLDKEIMIKQILICLDKLRPNEKEIIILRYIEELEINEIATIINKNKIATKVAIYRAIKNLRKIVNNKNE